MKTYHEADATIYRLQMLSAGSWLYYSASEYDTEEEAWADGFHENRYRVIRVDRTIITADDWAARQLPSPQSIDG